MALPKAVADEVAEIMRVCQETGQVVQQFHALMGLLLKKGLMHEVQLHPDEVGCSPDNRDGFGLCGGDCHSLLDRIASVGWQSRETNPICYELGFGDAQDKAQSFNQALASDSGGLIPTFPVQIRFASLSSSHTNAALRALLHEAPHPAGGRLCAENHLSLAMADSVDPMLAQAARVGMTWRVIAREAHELDGVAQLIQQAANTTGHVAKGEHEWQLMMRIARVLKKQPEASWDPLKAQILASRPTCASACPYMFAFLKHYCSATEFQRIESRIKRSSSETASVGVEFYKAVSANAKDVRHQHMFFRYCLLSCAYCCKSAKLNASDVRRALTAEAQARVLDAEKLVGKLRALVQNVGLSQDPVMDRFEDHVVLQVLQKLKPAKSLEGLALKLVDDIEDLKGVRISTDFDRFAGPKSASGKTSKASVQVPSLCLIEIFAPVFCLTRSYQDHVSRACLRTLRQREYDVDGKLMDESVLLREWGFHDGVWVKRKKDGAFGKILRMENSMVHLAIQTDQISEKCSVPFKSFLDRMWKTIKEPAAVLEFDFASFSHYLQRDMVDLMRIRGLVCAKLSEEHEKHAKTLEKLKVELKPSRGVICMEKMLKGKLKLVPVSHKLEAKQCGTCVCLGNVQGHKMWIQSSFIAPGKDGCMERCTLFPFWLVQRTNKSEEANMEVTPCILPDETNASVRIPCLVNTKPISLPERLVLFEEKAMVEDEEEPLEVEQSERGEPAAKRQRIHKKGASE